MYKLFSLLVKSKHTWCWHFAAGFRYIQIDTDAQSSRSDNRYRIISLHEYVS